VCNPTLETRDANLWFNTLRFRNPANVVIGNVPRSLSSTREPGLGDVALCRINCMAAAQVVTCATASH
jgi:hypothetical protein